MIRFRNEERRAAPRGAMVCGGCMGGGKRFGEDCERCKGTGDEPCSVDGCDFPAVTQVAGLRYCKADGALQRMAV